MRTVRVLEFVIGILIAVVWIQSATAHIGNSYLFLASIYKYRLVGSLTGKWIAMLLPAVQLTLGVCLLSRIYVGGALLASTILFSFFGTIQLSAWLRGLRIDCGCFGPGASHPIGEGSVTMVFGLAAISLIGLIVRRLFPVDANPTKSDMVEGAT